MRCTQTCAKGIFAYTIARGSAVRSGRRQSMPSSSMANCARVSAIVPWSTFGQTNRPRSNRFANRHRPSPSNHSSLIRSPRLPRNTNTCPLNGFCSSAVCTIALKPTKPRRRSVRPATIQICVLAGIMPAAVSFQHSSQQPYIRAALDANLCARQLDVNRPGRAPRRRTRCWLQRDRQQLRTLLRLTQPAGQVQTPPGEQLVRIYAVRAGHTRHRCTRHERRFHKLALGFNITVLPLRRNDWILNYLYNLGGFGSAHLYLQVDTINTHPLRECTSFRRGARCRARTLTLCSNDSSVLYRGVTPQKRARGPCGLSLRPPSCDEFRRRCLRGLPVRVHEVSRCV